MDGFQEDIGEKKKRAVGDVALIVFRVFLIKRGY